MAGPQQELESKVGTLFTNLGEEAKVDPGMQPGYDITYRGITDRVKMVQFRGGEFTLLTEIHGLIKPKDVTSCSWPPNPTEVNIGDEYLVKVRQGDEILTLTARVLAQRSLGPGSLTYLRVVDSDDICIISTYSLKKN